jgi:hypothetical protein
MPAVPGQDPLLTALPEDTDDPEEDVVPWEAAVG